MKTAIKGLLRTAGLVPATDAERLVRQSEQATARAAELEDRVAKLRGDVATWKQHYEESAAAIAEWKHAAGAAASKAERAEAEARKAEARAEELKTRSDMAASQIRALRERLDQAQHVAASAREHLMATEMKLDLIEAAIQVLDTRTRESVATEP
jgi:chromosome segregation ATPase